jgi:hypothetical protein
VPQGLGEAAFGPRLGRKADPRGADTVADQGAQVGNLIDVEVVQRELVGVSEAVVLPGLLPGGGTDQRRSVDRTGDCEQQAAQRRSARGPSGRATGHCDAAEEGRVEASEQVLGVWWGEQQWSTQRQAAPSQREDRESSARSAAADDHEGGRRQANGEHPEVGQRPYESARSGEEHSDAGPRLLDARRIGVSRGVDSGPERGGGVSSYGLCRPSIRQQGDRRPGRRDPRDYGNAESSTDDAARSEGGCPGEGDGGRHVRPIQDDPDCPRSVDRATASAAGTHKNSVWLP